MKKILCNGYEIEIEDNVDYDDESNRNFSSAIDLEDTREFEVILDE